MTDTWLTSAIALAALGLVYFLIRKLIADYQMKTAKEIAEVKTMLGNRMDQVWIEINQIKRDYMDERTHLLICGKNALEIEKMFASCLKQHKDELYEHIRQVIKEIKQGGNPENNNFGPRTAHD